MAYQISKFCAKCHSCEMECPAGAVYLDGIDYTIDPALCTGCGHCAEICPVSAISDSEKPERPAAHQPIVIDADLCVIGGGGGGMVAAVKFAQLTGKKAVVLEKAKKIGGDTNLAHGFGAVYSKMQRDAGDQDTREKAVKDSMERSHGLYDEEMVRRTIYSTGEFFDWLCEFGGAEEAFTLVGSEFGPQDASAVPGNKRIAFPNRMYANLKCEDQAVGPGWMGTYVIEKMREASQALGVDILTEHEAIALQKDEHGRLCGVLVKDPGGQTTVRCRQCVIAAGGFSFNDEMIRKVRPEFFDVEIIRQSVPTTTGDGIRMAEEFGAQIDYDNIRVAMASPAHHPFGYSGYRYLQQNETVIVNLDGRRFAEEEHFGWNSNFQNQRRGLCYAIIDEALLETFAARLIANPPDGNEGWILEKYREEIEKDVRNSVAVKRANAIEELAEQFAAQFAQTPRCSQRKLRNTTVSAGRARTRISARIPPIWCRWRNRRFMPFTVRASARGLTAASSRMRICRYSIRRGKKFPACTPWAIRCGAL